jgi:uncharacterized membrane protein YkvA (DUF1232 family)
MANDTGERESCEQGEGARSKCTPLAKRAGRFVLEKALCLFIAAKAKQTPAWAKSAILGAVLYYFSPVDLIPDKIPVYGKLDDYGVILAAIRVIYSQVTAEIRAEAARMMQEWFG